MLRKNGIVFPIEKKNKIHISLQYPTKKKNWTPPANRLAYRLELSWRPATSRARIDANRIVSYYDFDGRGNPIRKPRGGSVETAEDEESRFPWAGKAWEMAEKSED